MSGQGFATMLWVFIWLACLAICVVIYYQGKEPEQRQPMDSGTLTPSNSQIPSIQGRSKRIWRKLFPNRQNESKVWPAIRRFVGRLKSRVGDVEMQRVRTATDTAHQPGDWTGATPNPNATGRNLRDRAGSATRFHGPRHFQADRGRSIGGTVEDGRQHSMDDWERTETSTIATTVQDLPFQLSSSQLDTDWPATPERVAHVNTGRLGIALPPNYEVFRRRESLSPSIPEIPPPTYAQHTDDEAAYLHDYEDLAHAAEGVRYVHRLPPYAPSWLPAPAAEFSSSSSSFSSSPPSSGPAVFA